ncbi:MAG: hypothetical protein M1836_006423 [Candelina mexicana]|nr:MAG: hypothetical protein M1836_006423 [Candelina mexicana]
MSSFTPINGPSSSDPTPTLNLAERVCITLFCKLGSQNCNHACMPGTSAEHHGHANLLRNPYRLGLLQRQNHPPLTGTRATEFVALYIRLGYRPEVVPKEMEVHKLLREKLYAGGDLGKCYLVNMREDCCYCKVTYRHNLIVRADGVGTFQAAGIREEEFDYSIMPKPEKKRKADGQRSETSISRIEDEAEALEESNTERGNVEVNEVDIDTEMGEVEEPVAP